MGAGRARAFDPVGPAAAQVFDAPLVALIRRDQRNARGEVGALDGDPLCDCQDDAGMTWRIAGVVPQGADKAVARVRLTFPQTPRPRTDATLSDPEFVSTKAHCLEVFQREVRRA